VARDLLGSIEASDFVHANHLLSQGRKWTYLNHFSHPEFFQFVTEKAHEAKEQLKEAEEFEHLPFIHRMLKYRNYLTNEALSSEAAVAETVAHLCGPIYMSEECHSYFGRLAGADPTSATLAYFLWEISRNPEVSNKLRAEIDAVMPDADVIPELSVLHELSYLTAFIQEGESCNTLHF
jgi:hypothetical protein